MSNPRLTTKTFILRSNIIHNNTYTYNNKYKGYTSPIEIICPIHGKFDQTPKNHLNGRGCQYCGGTKKLTNSQFKYNSNKIHNFKYTYPDKYINSITPINILCPIHGIYIIKPYKHLQGQGCNKCNGNELKSNDEFLLESNKIHNFKYTYPDKYINSTTPINILCPIHGKFKQLPKSHIKGHGCSMCNESKGEKKIRLYLKENNINFIYQKRFKDCKNINTLPFDFYLPKQNMCIEFDGKQHFEINNYFGGIIGFNQRTYNDKMKNNFCKDNNIHLTRIKYDDDIISCLNNQIKNNVKKINNIGFY